MGRHRIHSELTNLGVAVAPSTVWKILRAAGIDPAPRRSGPAWRQFLHVQATGIVAVDFLHADTVLLRRLYILVFIVHGTRRIYLRSGQPVCHASAAAMAATAEAAVRSAHHHPSVSSNTKAAAA